MITPAPTPYEALDYWSDNADGVSRALAFSRAITLATMIGVPLTFAVDHYLTGAHLHRLGIRELAAAPLLVVIVAVLAAIIKLSIGVAVRVQAARLDEHSALERVLELIAEGTQKRPKRAKGVMAILRLNLPKLVDEGHA